MRNLSRRLSKLEIAIPAPDDGRARRCDELINQLSSSERDALKEAVQILKEGADSPKDRDTVRSILNLAKERLDAGYIAANKGSPEASQREKLRYAL